MNYDQWEELRRYKNSLSLDQLSDLKESEIERLSYNQVDPLNIMIHLDNLKLLWY